MFLTESADYQTIFVNDLPLMDLRAPVEFAQGAFDQAINLPLMNDEERHAVGICYKQHGQQAAIALGERLVGGAVREQRLTQWLAFCRQHPDGYLYCLRGGLRSHITQRWLREAGVDYPLIQGGYKRLRRFLMEIIAQSATVPMRVVAGNTGCGKTLLIRELPFGVDLEGAARHRGSSFGRTLLKQSVQVNFEHRLAVALLKKRVSGITHWAIEDEGKTIGSNHVPPALFTAMQCAKIVVIDDPFALRLSRLKQEYIDNMQTEFIRAYGEEIGWQTFGDYLRRGLFAIRKRLGMQRYQTLLNELNQALLQHQQSADSAKHENWLVPLLVEYYDPMYAWQLQRKSDRILFRGHYAAVRDFLMNDTS